MGWHTMSIGTVVFDDNGLIVTQEQIGSGTGNYSTFLRVHDVGQTSDNVELGFNTDASSETVIGPNPSDMLDTFTHALKLSDIPVVTINGVEYLQFGLDTNEAQNLISVTEFKIYQAATGTVSSQAALGTAQFDMDGGPHGNQTINLTDYGSGSGTSNFAFYVPKSSIDTSKEYVYLFAKFTNAEGGFEEWGTGKAAVAAPAVTHPGFEVDKTVDKATVDGVDTLTYTVTVANSGDTALHVNINDPGYAVGLPAGDTDGDGVLDVGETWIYTFNRSVTQEDIDQGTDLSNTVTVTTEAGAKSDTVTTSVHQNPSMAVSKTVEESSVNQAGQTIHYGISVKNDGNVTLDAPVVSDANATGVTYTGGDSDSDGKLDVGETWTFAATHTVTQDELDHGGTIQNTASASSGTIYTHTPTSGSSNQVETTLVQNPVIDVAKALNPFATDGSYAHTDSGNAPIILVGDKDSHSASTQLSWQYTVTNAGNVTLKDVGVSDDVVGAISLSTSVLAPNGSVVGTGMETAANVAGLHGNTATASGTPKYGTVAVTDTDTGAYVGAQGDIVIDKVISVDNGLTWSQGPVVAFQGLQLAYKVTVTDNSDSGLHVSGIGVTDSQATVTGVVTSLAHGASDASNVYYATATGADGTNVASVTATVSDDYGHSMGLSDTDSASYTTVQALAGLSKGYWANHTWDARVGSTITLGDSDLSFNATGDKYAITFDKAGALAMDNSSATGDARIILGGQLVAAQLNTYMTGTTAKGLVDAGAKWFYSFGLQDDNTGYNASTGAETATGMTVTANEWANNKNGFTFKEGGAVSTTGSAWKGDLFSFNYTSQVGGEVHKVGVTGEGLKNALAAYDHGISGSDGLVVSAGGGLIAWQNGSGVFAQYDNTSNDTFWNDLKGGAFLKVLNDAELKGLINIVGIHDDHGNVS